MKKVAVVGVGQLPFRSRYADKTFYAMGMEVSKKALEDAGLGKEDIDLAVYSLGCDIQYRQQWPEQWLHDYLGLQGKPAIRVTALAATEGHCLFTAYSLITSGMADIVLYLAAVKGNDVYDFETRSRGDGVLKYGFQMHMNVTWDNPVWPQGVPAPLTAALLVPHIEKYGNPTPKQLAKVAVKNHKNAAVNPMAQLRRELTMEDVLNSRIIAWPTTMYMCSLYSDGAAALILASEDKAREITDKPIWVSGVACSEYSVSPYLVDDTLGRLMGTHLAGKKAYEMGGIKDPLNEIDLIEVYDFISGLEIMSYEELGLCKPGEGGKMVDEGVTEKEGWMPVNPSGGTGARGHVGAASGAYALSDIVLHLREEAGPIQVPIRKKGIGLMQCASGDYTMNSVVILQRER